MYLYYPTLAVCSFSNDQVLFFLLIQNQTKSWQFKVTAHMNMDNIIILISLAGIFPIWLIFLSLSAKDALSIHSTAFDPTRSILLLRASVFFAPKLGCLSLNRTPFVHIVYSSSWQRQYSAVQPYNISDLFPPNLRQVTRTLPNGHSFPSIYLGVPQKPALIQPKWCRRGQLFCNIKELPSRSNIHSSVFVTNNSQVATLKLSFNMPPKPSGKGAKKAVKSQKTVRKGGEGKKRRKSRKESYSVYIYRVLKQVNF